MVPSHRTADPWGRLPPGVRTPAHTEPVESAAVTMPSHQTGPGCPAIGHIPREKPSGPTK